MKRLVRFSAKAREGRDLETDSTAEAKEALKRRKPRRGSVGASA